MIVSDEQRGESGTSLGEIHNAAGAALYRIGQWLQDQQYHFITVTPATHARVNSRVGNEWAARIEDVFGWSRPFRAGLLPPALFELLQAAKVVEPQGDGWRSLIRASTLNGRIYLHSAFPTTASDAVFFGPDTYRFVSALDDALTQCATPITRAIDIGCGAGPGAIAIASKRPEAEVIAADINDRALRYTAVNAMLAGVKNVAVSESDLLSGVDGNFDLIIANPPYLLDRSERAYRHGGGALGEGLSLAIIKQALNRLHPGGTLLLYTGIAIMDGEDYFLSLVRKLLANANAYWDYREIDPDVFGEELQEDAYHAVDRIAAVVLKVVMQGR